MKKILLSLSMIAAVAVVGVGATGAFFSDSETSTGNTFTAGAIDLGVDNESYYNNQPNPKTSWALDWDIDNTEYTGDDPRTTDQEGTDHVYSLPVPRQFFNFNDLKPGDSGEDTISLHVNNNDSWLCADVTLTSNADNSINEPEADAGDVTDGYWAGELANRVKWYWWADDGDNVYEKCARQTDGQFVDSQCKDENLITGSGQAFPNASATTTFPVTLADSTTNIWANATGTPLTGASTRFIGKAWCFGDSNFTPYPQDGLGSTGSNGPDDGRGVVCDGSDETNITQTDSMTMDVSFRAVQSRHNGTFTCVNPQS